MINIYHTERWNKMTEKEKIAEATAILSINLLEQDKRVLDFYSTSIKFWQMEYSSLLDNEPFFKKKHQEWEKKVKETKEHLDNLYAKFDACLEECKNFKKDFKNI